MTITANDLRNVLIHEFDYVDEVRDDVEHYVDIVVDVDGEVHYFEVYERETIFFGSLDASVVWSMSDDIEVRNPYTTAKRLRSIQAA